MPTATGTFSLNPNFRLELSANVIGWEPNPFVPGQIRVIYQIITGIRRTSGTQVYSGTGSLAVGWGAGGNSFPFAYNFTGTDYVEISRENITRSVGETLTWAASTESALPSLGMAAASTPTEVAPPPSPGTVPTVTPLVFNAGTALTLTWTAANSAYRHDLYYTFGTLTNVTVATGLAANSAGYAFTPPLSLVSQIPNAPQGPFTITMVTRNGASGPEIGRQTVSATLMVPASQAPTVSAYSISDTNATVASQVGAYVQGLSVLRLNSITSSPQSGASIVNTRLTVEGLDLRVLDTKQLMTSGVVPLTARAWDSRGLSGTLGGSITVLPYTAPAVTGLSVIRTDAAGNPLETGTYLKVSATAAIQSLINTTQRNALTVTVETRPYGTSTWTVRNTITPGTLTYNTPFLINGGAIFANNGSFDVRYTASDKFNSTVVIQTVATGAVTVDMVGASVGIGKIWERGGLDVSGRVFSTLTAQKQTGTLVERDAITAKPGDEWFDTGTGLTWQYVGSTWLLVAGQVLANMEYATNATGASGTLVGSVISTPVLPVGQRVKVSASYSQYASAATTASFVVMQSRNSATDVTYATYDKRSGTRGYSVTSGAVHTSVSPTHFLTATSAAKISAAIYLATASSAVYGGDLIQLWIESA